MRKLPVLAAVLLSVATTSVRATPPTLVTGTFILAAPPIVVDVRFADGNTFVTQITTFTLAGDLAGTYTGETQGVIHASGAVEANGFRTFTGMLDGEAVTLEFRELFFGEEGGFGAIRGLVTTLPGSSVHCQGTFSGVGFAGTYELRCH